jgi:hypothetical protein
MNADKFLALQQLQQADPDGLLKPAALLEAASDPMHPLHSDFTWDNAMAGHAYRLQQARVIIHKAYLLNPEALTQTPQVYYVSLMQDRARPGGGYRSVQSVIESPALREELLRTAKLELASWVQRHQMLTELVSKVAAAAEIEAPLPQAERTRRSA